MKVSEQKIDEVNSIIRVQVEKDDYQTQVDKSLQNFRQKANIPGFRPGKVPAGLIKKMYGKSVLVEEINKVVSDNLFGYIRENKLGILGEPLPDEIEQQEIDFDTQEDFEFVFDIGLAPEISVALSKKDDEIEYYTIKVDNELLDKQIKSYAGRYGSHQSVDDQVSEADLVKGVLTELDADGKIQEGGIVVEDAVLMPAYMKDEEEKNKFIGAEKGNTIIMNPHKAYNGHEAELSSFLHIPKENVKDATSDFSFEITDITRYKEAEVNQELFDKAFGEGVVKSEDEFRAKVKEDLEHQFVDDSDYKFMLDIHRYIVGKIGPLNFPDAFIKRWVLASNEKNTPENIEKDYPRTIEGLTWQLIKEKLAGDYEIKVEESDLTRMAKKVTGAQFANYGITNVPVDMLENYAKEMLGKKDKVQDLANRVIEEKLTQEIKKNVTLNEKEVTLNQFNQLFAENKDIQPDEE
ncbi:MAG: trigger factor [Candidatus Azobacteroides sp.]|nr:trigger factor [Candidatus Azobacteroides sp.]